jgi:hypothetical protein
MNTTEFLLLWIVFILAGISWKLHQIELVLKEKKGGRKG